MFLSGIGLGSGVQSWSKLVNLIRWIVSFDSMVSAKNELERATCTCALKSVELAI